MTAVELVGEAAAMMIVSTLRPFAAFALRKPTGLWMQEDWKSDIFLNFIPLIVDVEGDCNCKSNKAFVSNSTSALSFTKAVQCS